MALLPNTFLYDGKPAEQLRVKLETLMKHALLNFILLSLSLGFPLRSVLDRVILDRATHGDTSELIAAVNDVRNANGVGLLRVDEALMVAAQRHSEYQASICQGTHTEPGCSQVRDPALAAGYGNGNDIVVRENVDEGPQSPEKVVHNWILSPGHFQTLIYPEDTDIGVGVAWGCS
jgi:uncharacterized protein YkwD